METSKMSDKMKIKVVLDKNAIMPIRAHPHDAGLDLMTPVPFMLSANDKSTYLDIPHFDAKRWRETSTSIKVASQEIDTGVHIQIPPGYCAEVKSKSGLFVKYGIITCGVIDSGYTGSIHVKICMLGDKSVMFETGDKIAQLVIYKCELPQLCVVDELEKTERGDGGFGSTGR